MVLMVLYILPCLSWYKPEMVFVCPREEALKQRGAGVERTSWSATGFCPTQGVAIVLTYRCSVVVLKSPVVTAKEMRPTINRLNRAERP